MAEERVSLSSLLWHPRHIEYILSIIYVHWIILTAVYFNIVNVFLLQINLCFPEEGSVYDYRLDDGIRNQDGDDEDEGGKVNEQKFLHRC